MALCVGAFVVPVPTREPAAYCRMARKAGWTGIEDGAPECRACVVDKLRLAKFTSLPQGALLKDGEQWCSHGSPAGRAQRDGLSAQMLADLRLAGVMDPGAVRFDAERTCQDGFKELAAR